MVLRHNRVVWVSKVTQNRRPIRAHSLYLLKHLSFLSSLIAMYFVMPETENRTLEEVEVHFSDNNRKITDIRIRKIQDIEANKAMQLAIEINNRGLASAKPGEVIEIKPMTPSVILDMVATNKSRGNPDGNSDGFVNRAFINDDDDKAK